MNLIVLLWKEQRAKLVLTIALLATHTVLNLVLIGVIGRYTTQLQAPPYPWWQFLLLMCAVVGALVGSALLTNSSAFSLSTSLRALLLTRITRMPLASLERIGRSRIVTSFVDDVERIGSSLQTIVAVAKDLGLVLGILAYLAVLSPLLIGVVGLVLLLAAGILLPLRQRGLKFAISHRSATDRSFALLNDLLDGIKQVKSHATLRSAALDSMHKRAIEAKQFGMRMTKSFTFGVQSSLFLFFALFLVLTYVRVDTGAGADVMAAFVVGLLIVLNPLVNAAFAIQQVDDANLSLSRINSLLQELDAGQCEAEPGPVGHHEAVTKLELRDVYHAYCTAQRQEFALGPVNFTVRAGESLFIAGGNGTGKTTLLKLITGLYVPSAGEIRVNDVKIDATRLPWLRQQFSAVFSDSCLFESLRESEFDQQVSSHSAAMLDELRLGHALDRNKTLLSQVSSCSSGERKRISLLLARLYDGPIYVFDEFAADQDPLNKTLFYEHIIADLKVRGKIVIVITHDDRYFGRADHLLMLERGLSPVVRHKNPEELGLEPLGA